jgi:hypothetical protein
LPDGTAPGYAIAKRGDVVVHVGADATHLMHLIAMAGSRTFLKRPNGMMKVALYL